MQWCRVYSLSFFWKTHEKLRFPTFERVYVQCIACASDNVNMTYSCSAAVYVLGLFSEKRIKSFVFLRLNKYTSNISHMLLIMLTWLTHSLQSYIKTRNEAFHVFPGRKANHKYVHVKGDINWIIWVTFLNGTMF